MSLFFGCASVSNEQRQKWAETAPLCFTKADCDAKWAATRTWIQQNAGYKIQIYSEDLIETHNSMQYDTRIAVSASKNPVSTSANGYKTYRINVRVSCGNIFGCIPTINDSILGFNSYVSSVQSNDATCYSQMLDDNHPRIGFFPGWFNKQKLFAKTICNDSPAQKAGILPNDQIVKIGDVAINSTEDAEIAFKKLKFGDSVDLEILRNDTKQSLSVKLPAKDEVMAIKSNKTENRAPSQKASIEERIESLSRLLKKGLINQEEYEMKKKQLLSDM